jgi:hypothetical protein
MEPNVPAGHAEAGPPPVGPAAPAPCWRCGTPPEDRYQEYCLECGVRLARYYPRSSFFRRETWSRESPAWLWVTMLALLLLALAATAIVAAATREDDGGRRPRGAAAGPTTSTLEVITDITTATVPTDGFTVPTFTNTTPTATVPTTPPPPPPPPAPTGQIISWPAGKSGYTIVLASIPTNRGRDDAEAEANDAIDAGISNVGILNSSDYASLNAGYYVVFSGVYDTEQQANANLASVRSRGYPAAYSRDIQP